MKNTTRDFRPSLASLASLATACIGLLAAPSRAREPDPAGFPQAAPEVRVWITPMAGGTSLGPGAGIGLNASGRHLMGGLRAYGAEEFCLFCHDREAMGQVMALIGPKLELPVGYLALQTGLAQSRAKVRGKLIEEGSGGFFGGPEYEMEVSQGVSVPLVVDAFLSTRHIGFGGTWIVNVAGENPGTAFFFSVPLGLVRGRAAPVRTL